MNDRFESNGEREVEIDRHIDEAWWNFYVAITTEDVDEFRKAVGIKKRHGKNHRFLKDCSFNVKDDNENDC